MLANKIRNDAWWLVKCFDYLINPIGGMPESLKHELTNFRGLLVEKMESHAVEVDNLHIIPVTDSPCPSPCPCPCPSPAPCCPSVCFASPIERIVEAVQHVSIDIRDILTNTVSSVEEPKYMDIVTKEFPSSSSFPPYPPSPPSPPSPPPSPVSSTFTVEEEAEEEEAEEEEAEEEVEEEEVEEEEEEVEEEEEEVEEEEEEEEEEEVEEEEVEVNYEPIRIKKRTYWLETVSKKLYEYVSADDVGEVVGIYKIMNGIATIAPA
jgi:hypothetical protein